MERFDIDGNEQLTSLVEAAERGEEAAITRDGAVVATVAVRGAPLKTREGGEPASQIDWAALERLHAALPEAAKGGGAEAIRSLRDAGY